MNTISPIQLKKAAQQLPPSPQIFGKLGKLMKDPDTGLDDISELVNTDSSLTAQVLRLSNSALFGMGEPADSLDEAINRIGFRELFKLVGMAATSQVFAEKNVSYNIEGSALWENSLATGLAMESLARRCGVDEQEAYTIGLLRSMGKMVIDQCVKLDQRYPSYSAASELTLTDWEEANFGLTNVSVAGFILICWNFNTETIAAIEHQYHPGKATPRNATAWLLNYASGIAEKIGKGIAGEASYWDLSEESLVASGLSEDDIEAVAEETEDALNSVIASVTA